MKLWLHLVWLWSGLMCREAVGGRSYEDVVVEDHAYYTMSVFQDNSQAMYDKHWVNMSDSNVHQFLSTHGQAAEAFEPGFIFPFYGHLVHRFFVTTHGFLSFSPRIHNLLYKTQYVAPLRVKLDPSRSNSSTINYIIGHDRLTVQWTNVSVAEPFEHPLGGMFTFQVTLHANGDIAFVYIDVPELLAMDALYDEEPVAGLSDAFLLGHNELHVYHAVNVDNTDIRTDTVVFFEARPTCITQLSCEDCVTMRSRSPFQCSWCQSVRRCSDGADRLREHWDQNECAYTNISAVDMCAHQQVSSIGNPGPRHLDLGQTPIAASSAEDQAPNLATVVSAVVSAFLVLVLLIILTAFVYLYGRNNPGGLAERLAMRLERNYKRFGLSARPRGRTDEAHEIDRVELERKVAEAKCNNNNNNNNNMVTLEF